MLAAPADTPKDIVAKLHAEFKAIAALPDVKQQFDEMGLVPIDPPPVERLQGSSPSEIERWGKIMRDAGIAGSE